MREKGDPMQISSRFTIAVHIFACIEAFGDQHKLTSDFLAGSVNVNPVIIRKTMSQLQKARHGRHQDHAPARRDHAL